MKMLPNLYKKSIINFIKLLSNETRTLCNIATNTETKITLRNENIDKRSVLDPCEEDISHFTPNLRPTFNLAAYVDQSPTLQELIKLGVNLHQVEKKQTAAEFLLQLNFENDIKKYLLFLHDHGISADHLGRYLTKNPLILKEDLDYLHVRIDYLKLKKFTPLMIAKIIENNPFWLMFSTERIDRRLGYFQTTFSLSGHEVRTLAYLQPRLITYSMHHVRVNTFAIKEELGFEAKEMKKLLLKRPKLWMINQNNLVERFSFVHNEMKIPHNVIVRMPDVLYCRKSRLRERHLFLVKLNRAQYDPTKENYVSLDDLVRGTDAEFCTNIAKTTPDVFNAFLKTL